MLLLNGEGEHAFVRLQEKIIRHSDDLSVFAWKDPQAADAYMYRGLLARSASGFAHCGGLEWNRIPMNQTIEVSSKDITIDVLLSRLESPDDYFAIYSGVGGQVWGDWLGIFLQKTSDNHFVRVSTGSVKNSRDANFSDPRSEEECDTYSYPISKFTV